MLNHLKLESRVQIITNKSEKFTGVFKGKDDKFIKIEVGHLGIKQKHYNSIHMDSINSIKTNLNYFRTVNSSCSVSTIFDNLQIGQLIRVTDFNYREELGRIKVKSNNKIFLESGVLIDSNNILKLEVREFDALKTTIVVFGTTATVVAVVAIINFIVTFSIN